MKEWLTKYGIGCVVIIIVSLLVPGCPFEQGDSPDEFITRMALGAYHSCVLTGSGDVQCWGSNYYGDFGDGSTVSSFSPVRMKLNSRAVSITAGKFYTCAAMMDGRVYCSGWIDAARVPAGFTPSNVPAEVAGFSGVKQVAGGESHVCGLLADGTVECWGTSICGLGDGSSASSSSVPVKVAGITGAVKISADTYSTCALLDTGQVKCWGPNFAGQAGSGYPIPDISLSFQCLYEPVLVDEVENAVDVAVGLIHACAVLRNGKLMCWGNNSSNQLGREEREFWNPPLRVPGISGAMKVSAGGFSSCALSDDGSVKWWGSYYGYRPQPEKVDDVEQAMAVFSGEEDHNCAIQADGEIKCWGLNSIGQLGNGGRYESRTPIRADLLKGASRIFAGFEGGCAILASGEFACWGNNDFGQLGVGDRSFHPGVEVLSGVAGVIHASLSSSSCAVVSTGEVWCWGAAYYGSLGNGQETGVSLVPVRAKGITDARKVISSSCALHRGGGVSCWGMNTEGELGDGSTADWSIFPVRVSGIEHAFDLAGTSYYHCALLEGGSVECWGRDYDFAFSHVPRRVGGLSDAIHLAVGDLSCALRENGSVACWEPRGEGGTFDEPGFAGALSLAAGPNHICALFPAGNVKCRGNNYSGNLGGGRWASDVPVDVVGVTNAKSLSCGYDFCCVILDTGAVKCWGRNIDGELALGKPGYSPIAVTVDGTEKDSMLLSPGAMNFLPPF